MEPNNLVNNRGCHVLFSNNLVNIRGYPTLILILTLTLTLLVLRQLHRVQQCVNIRGYQVLFCTCYQQRSNAPQIPYSRLPLLAPDRGSEGT